jgi:hypothetical protein
MQQIVVLQDPHRTSPLERCQRCFYRAAKGIVEGKQPWSLARPKNEVGESLRTIGEGADNEGLRGRHPQNIAGQRNPGYGTSSDFGSTRTIHSPELMSGT